MWRQENTNRTKGNTDLTIRLRQQRKNIILNEDSSSKTMKPVWNPHSFCGTKKNKGEVKYWRTLLSSGPILNWGKQNIGFFSQKTSSAPMLSIWSFWKVGGYQVLVSFSRKHFLAILPKPLWLARFKALRDGYYPLLALLLDITWNQEISWCKPHQNILSLNTPQPGWVFFYDGFRTLYDGVKC